MVYSTPPAEGERRALRGYIGQYEKSGAAIYVALERDQLRWIGIADRSAGIADDLVLGFDGLVIGHQFKTSKFPGTFTIGTILTGADGLLTPLIHAWTCLSKDNPDARVEIRLIVNDIPSVKDKPGDVSPGHSAAFLDEFERFPNRPLKEWQLSSWSRLIDMLLRASGLNESEFERFLHGLRVVHGAAADLVQTHKLSTEQSRLALEIAKTLPKLVTDTRDKDRWSRDELLQELGWRDPAKMQYIHRFPVGAYVQRNRETEISLLEGLRTVDQGYLSLIGPPGSGKSTLLQVALATEPNIRLVRYLAYVPGAAQGVGRGEADSFFDDVNTQLRNSGLVSLRLRDNSLHERREQFGALLKQAGERYERDGIRTIIVVDGLDHVPREERPTHSLLGELPLPVSIPKGVTFVLGTQRLDLAQLKPALKEQAEKSGRLVQMRPLGREAIARIADTLGLAPAISRVDVSNLSHGHPLASRYLIQALLNADDVGRQQLLAGSMKFDGDIESVYTSAWREITGDSDAMDVLGFIARAEAPMPLQLLAKVVEERAIERALVVARHLLRDTPQGWSVFHNSFRLFVIAQPRMRLGRIDADYSQRVYRDLAQLSKIALKESSQRWFELRYRARAGDIHDVLMLATPDRFRQQLAAGRPISDIHADIRLSLFAVRSTLDATTLTRLLLCSDEVGRREIALEYSDRLPLAMLAVGDIDAAVSFVQDFPSRGYEVVDHLLQHGDFDRAKDLFETLEPLSQLHASKFQNYGDQHNLKEFEKWARRAFHFRDAEQIQQSIDHLATEGMRQTSEVDSEETTAAVKRYLRREAAEAMLQHNGTDPEKLCGELSVAAEDRPSVIVHAGLAAHERGNSAQALALFDAALQLPEFDEISNGLRRSVALVAITLGRCDLASVIFEKLIAPMVSMGDDDTDPSGLVDLVSAVMHHARLCALLEKPLPDVTPSKHPSWQPLQTYASKIGMLLGCVAKDPSSVYTGGVQILARKAMGYLLRLSPKGGGDSYRVQQAMKAVSVLAHSLLNIAAKCDESEYCAVLKEIDDAIATSPLNGLWYIKRRLAVETYRIDGHRAAAVARLDALAVELQEDTPSEQLDGLADLAISFAAVGDVERAKLVLATAPEQCLGYALPPKKDPQYAIWRDIMVLANGVDPGRRAQRISVLMRQVGGMTETEGSSAAGRLSMPLIDEAMQVGPRFGFEVSKTLAHWNLIPWSNKVDMLMIGMVRRRPESFVACTTVWCGLCLPFYMEPFYRDPYHIGDFIDVAANAAGPGQIAQLVQMLLDEIELASRAHERLSLLKRLRAAAARHGLKSAQLDASVERWSSEAPEPRYSYTPSKYDSEPTLEDLERAFEADGDELNHNAPYRFAELAESAPLHLVQRMYERWESLQSDTRCRFLLVKRLAKVGEVDYARKLVRGYEQGKDPWSSWSQWMGGGKFLYFEARRLLDGDIVYPTAFENLVDSVLAGQENRQSLLTELDSILPVISLAPDWPAIWSLLAEQMTCTREFQIGKNFEPAAEPLDDEEILVELLHFALRLPVAEVQRNARNCALKLAVQPTHGETVSERVMRRLLDGDLDAPLQALQILLLGKLDHLAPLLGPTAAKLVSHRDFAVAEAATLLSKRWGNPILMDGQPLPLFYKFELVGSLKVDRELTDERTGAMRVESELGWTQILRSTAQALAKAADVDELTIRRRAAMFIQEWGGLEAFGPNAVTRVEDQLRALDMKIKYLKPHALIGVIALRHVAGELHQAGLLKPNDLPMLLESMNAPIPPLPLSLPQVRPKDVRRPLVARNARWMEGERKWTEGVVDDIATWSDQGGEHVVAEVSQFKIFKPRQAELLLHRIRAPGVSIDDEKFDDCYQQLPAAVWIGRVLPFDNEPAPTLIRRLVCSVDFGLDSVAYPIVLCPNLLRQLQWRAHADAPGIYIDSSGAIVARIVWWRDAGPVDIDDESIWGEGCYIALTKAGLARFAAARGKIVINVFASREAQKPREYSERYFETAKNSYSI
ncbi:ATP-binding protein [Undibacterium pigrum]|uniref:ATP-binding protein n=1 Tax=Undibacterium pigrum TaxID=401470 RepID=UPI001FE56107|nr:ATP-binding protein [Undibacterium pigrum]